MMIPLVTGLLGVGGRVETYPRLALQQIKGCTLSFGATFVPIRITPEVLSELTLFPSLTIVGRLTPSISAHITLANVHMA